MRIEQAHLLYLTAVLATAFFADAKEEAPPAILYGNERASTGEVTFCGISYAVDRAVDWQGVRVYLALTSDLLGADAKTGKVLWHNSVSAYWRRVSFVEREQKDKDGQNAWAVELRPEGDEFGRGERYERYDLHTGQQLPVPSPAPAGQRLPPLRKLRLGTAVAKPFRALVSTEPNLERLRARLDGPWDDDIGDELDDPLPPDRPSGRRPLPMPKPVVDFEREVVLVCCIGDAVNRTGTYILESYEDDHRILLRTKHSGYQSFGRSWTNRLCDVFVLPRREGKAYIVELDVQSFINGPPVWKEVLRIERLDGTASELAAMPAPYKKESAKLPPGFERMIQTYTSPPQAEGSYEEMIGNRFEFEYYTGPGGRRVPHGKFRKYDMDGDKTVDLQSGGCADGQRDGAWTFLLPERDFGEDRQRFEVTYASGRRDGPFKVWDTKGRNALEGAYKAGAAHGEWTEYHENGAKQGVYPFRANRYHGTVTRWLADGTKAMEGAFEDGVPVGEHREWHPSGHLKWLRRYRRPAEPWTGFALETKRVSSRMAWAGEHLAEQLDGECIYYGQDGEVQWRSSFSDGSGTVADFHANGKKYYETVYRANQAVSFKEWTAEGILIEEQAIAEDGTLRVVEYGKRGKQKRETVREGPVRVEGLPLAVERKTEKLFGPNGEAVAEGVFLNGSPWSGDCYDVVSHSWVIGRYMNGKLDPAVPLRKWDSD